MSRFPTCPATNESLNPNPKPHKRLEGSASRDNQLSRPCAVSQTPAPCSTGSPSFKVFAGQLHYTSGPNFTTFQQQGTGVDAFDIPQRFEAKGLGYGSKNLLTCLAALLSMQLLLGVPPIWLFVAWGAHLLQAGHDKSWLSHPF